MKGKKIWILTRRQRRLLLIDTMVSSQLCATCVPDQELGFVRSILEGMIGRSWEIGHQQSEHSGI
jgi:hypothetical protein